MHPTPIPLARHVPAATAVVDADAPWYNGSITYTLAKQFMRIPARMWNRFRQFDQQVPGQDHASWNSPAAMQASHGAHQMLHEAPLPGPLGFVASGYFYMLIFMAVILHRVQNVVVPPRHSPAYTHNIRSLRRQGSFIRASWATFLGLLLPVDFSATRSRLIFRIPSMYLLLRSLTLWTVIMLQTADLWPHGLSGSLGTLGQWATQQAMEDVCWVTFKAVCVALFVGSLTSGMETLNPSGNAPFNLFGYAFVLYVYGSPTTHINHPVGAASRPDVHVIITMMLPLLQLTMIHCLEVKQAWGRRRLIPTTICGVISLVHFHTAFWLYPASYPLPNMFPNAVESVLLCITLITCVLNAVGQLLATGTISKPLVGHAATLTPKWDEDFSVAIFRLGTASLEATSVAGLGNEVGCIAQGPGDIVKPPIEQERGTVEVSRLGVVSIERPKRTQALGGFANEIKDVKMKSRPTDAWLDMLINPAWTKELGRFLRGLWRFVRGAWRTVSGYAKYPRQSEPHRDAHASTAHHRGHRSAAPSPEINEDVYDRFLRGDDLSDDEQDFDPSSHSRAASPTSSVSSLSDDEADVGSASDALTLYADLTQSAGASPAPLLLAHMTDTASSPLTRRRYSHLVRGAGSQQQAPVSEAWGEYVVERREAKRAVLEDDPSCEDRRMCVICTAEPREIVCWPCRCLALCDDCRENLASRAPASKHLCPCCRRNVEGFSKIYIP